MHITYAFKLKTLEKKDFFKIKVNNTYLYMLFTNYLMIYKQPNMTDKMLKFVNIGQQNPPKRSIDERNKDFKEIYREFIDE